MKCIYCGKPAGFLHWWHKACRELHNEAASKIPAFFVKSLKSDMEPDHFQEMAQQIANTHYIGETEFRKLVINGLKAMVEFAFAAGDLSEKDDTRIASFCNRFGLTANELGPAGIKLAKTEVLRRLDKGELPGGVRFTDMPVNLEKGESAIWLFYDVNFLTPKSSTHYVGGSQGVSIRVMKGIYYRVGSYRGAPVKTQYLSDEGRGVLVISNKNIYFWSPRTAQKIPFKKIISAHAFSDALQIVGSGSNAGPLIFKLDDPLFAADLVARASQL